MVGDITSPCDRRYLRNDPVLRCNNTNNSICHQMITFYRLLTIDCYMTRIFYPIVGILIIIGTILNLFSLYCFLKMKKRSSQNVYLSALSLGDTINLHLNFSIPLLRKFDVIDEAFLSSTIICQLNGFLTEFFLIFPTWIVVLLTFERFICIIWPLKRTLVWTQKRAKSSIMLLAVIVAILSIYRLYDLKGIDQVSVFQLAACSGPINTSEIFKKFLLAMRNSNLVIWAILPECLTLIMNLSIVYEIKLTTQKLESFYSEARMTRYNQATKTVLLISILFLIFHTPTGAVIGIHLFSDASYGQNHISWSVIILYVARKVTVVLYQISICCKFFIYNQTFRNFRNILHTSISRFTRRKNSAKLGRHINGAHITHFHLFPPRHNSGHLSPRTFHFGPRPCPNDALLPGKEENFASINSRTRRKSSTKTSTSTSKGSRGEQQQQQQKYTSVIMVKTCDEARVSIQDTPELLRRYTTGADMLPQGRLLWRSKPQTTV